MTYRGQMKNGVIVFAEPPPIKDGAEVAVEPLEGAEPQPGSPDAILRNPARWAGPPEELDRLLREVQEMREQDLIGGDDDDHR